MQNNRTGGDILHYPLHCQPLSMLGAAGRSTGPRASRASGGRVGMFDGVARRPRRGRGSLEKWRGRPLNLRKPSFTPQYRTRPLPSLLRRCFTERIARSEAGLWPIIRAAIPDSTPPVTASPKGWVSNRCHETPRPTGGFAAPRAPRRLGQPCTCLGAADVPAGSIRIKERGSGHRGGCGGGEAGGGGRGVGSIRRRARLRRIRR